MSLQWRHDGRGGVSKKTSKLRVMVTDEFPAQSASNAENVPFDDVIMSIVNQGKYLEIST